MVGLGFLEGQGQWELGKEALGEDVKRAGPALGSGLWTEGAQA